ncbi:MAG: S41 family peptidase [Candidatus Delongbacteria bacterium]|jgi:tricorn protease|nr:S41 family peptidase [Candidatus Delongbacteria bacterium]
MKFRLIIILLTVIQLFSIEPNFMSDPAISPDGNTVCFRYMQDLWTVPYDGGDAKRLTSVKGSDSNPDYSQNGEFIAFNSDRDGYNSVYVMPSEGGKAVKVITGDYIIVDWYNDSEHLLIVKGQRFVGNKMYKVKLDGTNLTDLSMLGFHYSDLSKENDKYVFCHRGDPFREKFTGSTNGSLHIFDIKTKTYSDLYDSPYTERYPVFSKNGNGIYFARSDSNFFQICNIAKDEIGKKDPKVKQLTNFKDWSARDISIAYKNDRMVFEFFDNIYKLDPVDNVPKKLEVNIKEDFIENPIKIQNNASTTDRFFVSPNGNWVLFKYKFDLFAVPYEGGEVVQVTDDANGIEDFVITSDNNTIYYSAFIKGELKMFKTSVKDPSKSEMVEWSKDKFIEWIKIVKGKMLVYYSKGDDRRRLAMKDLKKDEFNELVPDKYVADVELSEDGNLLLYTDVVGGLWSRNLYLLNIKEKKEKLLFTYYDWFWGLVIDPKEEFLFYNRGENVYRTDLKKLTDFHFEKDKWKDIFEPKKKKDLKKDKKKEKKEPSEFFTDNIKEKEVKLLSKPGMNYIVKLTKDQKIYYINEFDDGIFLRKTDFQAKEDELITEIKGGKIDNVTYSDSTGTISYLQNNKIKTFEIQSKKIKDTPFTIKYSYDQQDIYKKVFDEVHTAFRRGFYDPKMHNVDWVGMGEKFGSYVKNNQTSESLQSIINEMIGDVDASHTGYYPVRSNQVIKLPMAKIGAEFDYLNRLEKGITISKVYFKSKLASVHGIKTGDILLEVDGEPIERNTDIDMLFLNKVADRIKLKIKSGKKDKIVKIKGLSGDYNLKYEDWVNDRRKMVDELSGGKVGYLHIQGMDDPSYDKFLDDIFSDNFNKEALIIDVRYNGGGRTHDKLIEVLTKKQYAYSSNRRMDQAEMKKTPSDIWDKPSTVLINESSFSDAEIFPSLYKELKIGKVIGMPTSGGVIGTSPHNLMDGSSMRMPGYGWWRLDGQNMEGNGAQPDIFVKIPFEDKLNDNDLQLKRAVEEMLKEINK